MADDLQHKISEQENIMNKLKKTVNILHQLCLWKLKSLLAGFDNVYQSLRKSTLVEEHNSSSTVDPKDPEMHRFPAKS